MISDLHIFGRDQPDLNWDCKELRDELYDVLKFWLEKGIDGFRVRGIRRKYGWKLQTANSLARHNESCVEDF